jgi:16S rRNA (guanine1207-N2)-methyltransferase
LLQAYHALKPEGCLYIAGSNDLGIQSSVKDAAELFGNARILAYRKGNRLAHLVKTSSDAPLPPWASTPGIAPGTWVEFSINCSNHDFPIRGLPGVFSIGHLDEGTKLLVNAVEIHPGARVLDVGCGYGIIGLCASVKGCAWNDLVDSDQLAVASCRQTFDLNRISNFTVFAGDLLQPVLDQRYDLILSNPPFHAGRAVDYQVAHALIRQSFGCLSSKGQLAIVANRFLPYDRLIGDIFGNVSVLAESGKFYVLSGRKTS